MDTFEGPILWLIAMLLAPFVALIYFGRVIVTQLASPKGSAKRVMPGQIETLALGCCIVWIGIIAAIWFA